MLIYAGEIEQYQQELSQVQTTLEPWQRQLNDVRARLSLAQSEGKLLIDKV